MTPLVYTDTEGGDWKAWPLVFDPPVSFYSKRSAWTVKFTWWDGPGLQIHSLITPLGKRWDCVNGWTGDVGAIRLHRIKQKVPGLGD
jgi:hypothetical protein